MTNDIIDPQLASVTMPRCCVAIFHDPDLLRLMRTLLEGEGCSDVRLLASTENAQRIIKESGAVLVILDVYVESPRAGWQLLRDLRQDPETARIAVIVCTGDTPFLQANAHQLQDVGYHVLEQPFDVDDLVDILKTIFSDRSRQELMASPHVYMHSLEALYE